MFIILLFESNFFFLIDYLDSFPKLYCYTIRSFRCYPYQFYGYTFGCECDNSRDALSTYCSELFGYEYYKHTLAISGTTTFRIYLQRFLKFGKSFSTMIGTSFVSNFLWSEKGKENHWVPTLVPGATRCLSFRTRRMLVDCVSETHLSCLVCRVLRKLVNMRSNHIKYC